MHCGLRQGDPLSPFLFLIVAEALQRLIMKACDIKLLSGLFTGDGSNISLLQYADDALLFGYWSKDNIQRLMEILKLFHRASGLKINLDKSRLFGIGIDMKEVQVMADIFNCKADSFPFTYLGMPVGFKFGRSSIWNPVVDKMKKRLALWKAKLMSIGGRITLCNAVLDSLPVYFLSLFSAPSKTIQQLDKLRRRFLWGGKENGRFISWVAWDKICTPKKLGGLGLKDLSLFNISLLGKWKWRAVSEGDALWLKVISAIHGSSSLVAYGHDNLSAPSVWKNIQKSWGVCQERGIDLEQKIKRTLGNGGDTKFWTDNWSCLNKPLQFCFPRLFALDENKEALVVERINPIRWAWRSVPRGRANSDIEQLSRFISYISLEVEAKDSWNYSLDKQGMFSVKNLYSHLISCKFSLLGMRAEFWWNGWIPGKVNACVWRAVQDKLPTIDNLIKRGIVSISPECVLCGHPSESIIHTVFECPKVVGCWRKIFAWWKMAFPCSLNWEILKKEGVFDQVQVGTWKIAHGVFCTAIWYIWSWRNAVLFAEEEKRKLELQKDIFPVIQGVSFGWIRARSRKPLWKWDLWIDNPRRLVV